jgi:hypothetical protein
MLTMDSAYLFSARASARTLIPVIRTHDHDKSMRPSRATLYYAVVGSSAIHAVSALIVRPDPWCHTSMLDVHSPLLVLHSTRLKYRLWLSPHLSVQWEFEGQS